ncbi:hypothetical protein CS010_02510 [Streptococcus macedonicus]|uniref:Uncharacterized protein n=1 Tax=Streptococcus macedonicus TaxID=59310 RepID=A0A2G3NWT6_STRMC|nr:hypothetical protein CS010_02510 [Streptococcus macedonicus]
MLFIIGHMGLFFYTKKGSIISTVDLPTTEIIEPTFSAFLANWALNEPLRNEPTTNRIFFM